MPVLALLENRQIVETEHLQFRCIMLADDQPSEWTAVSAKQLHCALQYPLVLRRGDHDDVVSFPIVRKARDSFKHILGQTGQTI